MLKAGSDREKKPQSTKRGLTVPIGEYIAIQLKYWLFSPLALAAFLTSAYTISRHKNFGHICMPLYIGISNILESA